ncbi:hypothetical protein [Clostridium tertium]|uniref:hypothetical protein n=1 Tax=Clostridium tertium TaxID=1559 RepID=UPI0023B3245A|nr:hypothetical protein [Clostridium tertium]
MYIDLINKNSNRRTFTDINVLNLKSIVKDTELVLAFDQASRCTGATIGDNKGNELFFMTFVRDDKVEKDYMEYKEKFKEVFMKIFEDCKIDTILHEDTHTEGFVHTDKVLDAMRTTFSEIKYEYKLSYDIFPVKQQTWKSCFLIDGYKQQTKENVATVARMRLPYLDAVQDVYDSYGIYYYYKTQILPSKQSPIFKPYKGMKIDKRHHLNIRVVQLDNIHELKLTDVEYRRSQKYGLNMFLYDNSKWIEENCRMLTSHSNKLWIAELDNTNSGMYANAIWCNYDIIPIDKKKLFCIAYRTNKLSNATLDK